MSSLTMIAKVVIGEKSHNVHILKPFLNQFSRLYIIVLHQLHNHK